MEPLYKPVILDFTANTPDTITYKLVFTAIVNQYPNLNLDMDTHYIENVQAFPGRYRPDQAVIMIRSYRERMEQFRFIVDRYRIDRYLISPLFTTEELTEVLAMSEWDLIEYLIDKTGLNLSPRDFLIQIAGIAHTGGYQRPNYRLRARPDSPFWYGEAIIELHTNPLPSLA